MPTSTRPPSRARPGSIILTSFYRFGSACHQILSRSVARSLKTMPTVLTNRNLQTPVSAFSPSDRAQGTLIHQNFRRLPHSTSSTSSTCPPSPACSPPSQNPDSSDTASGTCATQQFIVVFARQFATDPTTGKPTADTGRCIVLRRGQTHRNWRLDHPCWNWHCGAWDNEWTGPVGTTILNPTDIPALGSLFSQNFPSWNKDHCVGAVSIDIEYTLSGHILFTAYTN
jgi:hypothetical protein